MCSSQQVGRTRAGAQEGLQHPASETLRGTERSLNPTLHLSEVVYGLLSPPQMIHNYMEHVERIKMQQISETSESSAVGRVR